MLLAYQLIKPIVNKIRAAFSWQQLVGFLLLQMFFWGWAITELPRWQNFPPPITVISADTGEIDPNGDGTTSGTETSCGGGGEYDCLDDGVRSPTAPSTTDDYVVLGNNDNSFYQMTTISNVDTVSQIVVFVYHQESANNMQLEASLFDAAESTQYGSTQGLTTSTTDQWNSVTFSGLSLSQSQLDGLRVELNCNKTGGGQPGECQAYAAYAEVTYTSTVAVSISITTDGSVTFGNQDLDTTQDTTTSDLNDPETVSVDTGPADLSIETSLFSDGSNTWSLGTSNGADQSVWEFSSDDGSSWSFFEAANTAYTIETNVPEGETRDITFRLTTPTSSTTLTQYTANVTITATTP